MQVRPGMKIANLNPVKGTNGINEGTIGGVVYYGDKKLLLTCFHTVWNKKLDWDDFKPNGIDNIVKVYTDNDYIEIGKIVQAHRDNLVDIALIETNPEISIIDAIPQFGKLNSSRIIDIEEVGETQLRKYGAITKDTYGEFLGFDDNQGFPYPGGVAFHYLDNLIKIQTIVGDNFSQPGDSGSFIIDSNNQVVGVLVGSDDDIYFGIQTQFIELIFNVKF